MSAACANGELMSDEQYYYLLDGKEHGPFSRAAIESLVDKGRMEEALFKTKSDHVWQTAREARLRERITHVRAKQKDEPEYSTGNKIIMVVMSSILALMVAAIGFDLIRNEIQRIDRVETTRSPPTLVDTTAESGSANNSSRGDGNTRASTSSQTLNSSSRRDVNPRISRRSRPASPSGIDCNRLIQMRFPNYRNSNNNFCRNVRQVATLQCGMMRKIQSTYTGMMRGYAKMPPGPRRNLMLRDTETIMYQQMSGPAIAIDEYSDKYQTLCR